VSAKATRAHYGGRNIFNKKKATSCVPSADETTKVVQAKGMRGGYAYFDILGVYTVETRDHLGSGCFVFTKPRMMKPTLRIQWKMHSSFFDLSRTKFYRLSSHSLSRCIGRTRLLASWGIVYNGKKTKSQGKGKGKRGESVGKRDSHKRCKQRGKVRYKKTRLNPIIIYNPSDFPCFCYPLFSVLGSRG